MADTAMTVYTLCTYVSYPLGGYMWPEDKSQD